MELQWLPQLLLYRGPDELIAQADGFTTGTAVIEVEADATGPYYLVATSALILESGAYTLSASEPPAGAVSAHLRSKARDHRLSGKRPTFERRIGPTITRHP